MSNPGKKSAFVHVSDMIRVECTATTQADPALAWKIFVDWRRWSRFTDMYGELRWTQGSPWDVGSRLRMELLRPAKFVVNRVITMCRPAEAITWIDHSHGSTVEQWVTFAIDPDGSTCIRILSQVVGSHPKIAGQPFAEFLKANVNLWLKGFCKLCDQKAAAAMSVK